jgi:pimeloyl-ACP methyl ester carboxylesterase
VAGKTRRLIQVGNDRVEIWTHRNGGHGTDDAELFVLKFPGAGGRAERGTDHPVDYWPGLKAELWTVNCPGYGGSSGRASLSKLAGVADGVCDELVRVAGGRAVLVVGNSLGTVAALCVAARGGVSALLLRNVLPLRELIVGHHGRSGLWLGSWLLSRAVPAPLDSVAHARRCRVPCLFVMSERDRTIPTVYQQQVIDAYAGPHQVMRLPDADHADLLSEEDVPRYARHLSWLRQQMPGGAES